ncbi:carbohydrate ABC transporter permease [Candidatus Eisenbacteria bacterium]|uniref:Carbohydrate ABC transporter permease n=1 Tax=Eiseniibacteriota bacterium TaxID=2212470 RepID=A0ABV6YNT8_UNCEI
MRYLRRIPIHVIIVIGALSMVLPFVWMLSTSFKSPQATFIPPNFFELRPTWIPDEVILTNYVEAWHEVPFPRYFLNTIFMAVCIVVGVLTTSSLAAYAFAKFDFWGRETIFIFFLSMMIVPQAVYLVPSFIILSSLGWVDTYMALIVPWLAQIFSIFLLRQQFRTIPNDYYDAALIDGCSRLGFLWRVLVPLSKPTLITIGLFALLGSWNSFIWPLIMTNSDKLRPIQVGLSYFAQEQGTEYGLMMAAATFCVTPVIIIYFIAQKQVIESYAKSGIKG